MSRHAERRKTSGRAEDRKTNRRAFAMAMTLVLAAGPLGAQTPTLAIAVGEGTQTVQGTASEVAMFPLRAIERMGGVVLHESLGHARALLFGDTIEFWPTAPFFRAHGALQPLVSAVEFYGGTVLLPEQFFIEWLPRRYPSVLAWSGGVLRQTASPSGPPARARIGGDGAARDTGGDARRTDANARNRRNGASQNARPGARDAGEADGSLRPLVVIDPGHGGPDYGKTGPNGLNEKDVVLDISKQLAAYLAGRGYEARLTRDRDTLIALSDRPRLANEWRGTRPAIFLSVHANSYRTSSVRGFETFFLSAARTEDEHRVAEMENSAARFEDRPAVAGDEVGMILDEMRNDFYVRASSDLAETVQYGLSTFHTGPNRGVKRAGFEVLVGALMPAVLVEVAFISNPQEARLLASSDFRASLVENIAGAIDGFFQRNAYLWAGGGW